MDDLTRTLPPALADWTCCPRCGGPVAPAVNEPGAQPHLRCITHGCEWYANPKPTASVLAVRSSDGALLLVRRAIEPFLGMWDTPGGFVEDGEEADAAAVREVREETGLRARITGIIGIYADTYGPDARVSTLNVFYSAVVDDHSNAAPASDVAELRWFARDELPSANELAFNCVPLAVAAWRDRKLTRARGV
jgi:ADP-ribose pyrophosphatase YjhB (NUDIX family)